MVDRVETKQYRLHPELHRLKARKFSEIVEQLEPAAAHSGDAQRYAAKDSNDRLMASGSDDNEDLFKLTQDAIVGNHTRSNQNNHS